MSDDEGVNENDIAIVGMALRVPGANSPAQFWDNLRSGTESIRDLDEETILASGESKTALRNPAYVRRAGELDDIASQLGEIYVTERWEWTPRILEEIVDHGLEVGKLLLDASDVLVFFGVAAVDVAGVSQPWLLAPLACDHEFGHRIIRGRLG